MKALITSRNGTYYVGKKSGKKFTYTEVKAETLVTVDRDGKVGVKTTVGGKALPAGTYLYESIEEDLRKCNVEDVEFLVNWSLCGNRLENVTGHVKISSSGIATLKGRDSEGNAVERRLPAGTYGICRFDNDGCDPVLDLDIPMDKDFHPDNECWDDFIVNEPERIIPKAGQEKKALGIMKAALDKVAAMGLVVVIDEYDDMFVVPSDADWESRDFDDAGADYSIEVPIRAFNYIHTGIRQISTDDSTMYLRPVEKEDEDGDEDED